MRNSKHRRQDWEFDLQLFALSATTSRNTRVISTDDGKSPTWPLIATNVVNAGDLICFDHSGGLSVKTPAAQSDMTYYIGVAEMQNPVSSGIDSSATIIGPGGVTLYASRSGIFRFYATAGETYTPLMPVYFNETASVQTVTNSTNSAARTIAVGLYFPGGQQQMRGGSTNLDVTAVTGTVIEVWLTPAYPVNPNTGVIPII